MIESQHCRDSLRLRRWLTYYGSAAAPFTTGSTPAKLPAMRIGTVW